MAKANIGNGFDDFLAEEAMLESSTAAANKRVIAWRGNRNDSADRLAVAATSLNRAYGDDEPEYSLSDIVTPP